jgi:hypothetical protein
MIQIAAKLRAVQLLPLKKNVWLGILNALIAMSVSSLIAIAQPPNMAQKQTRTEFNGKLQGMQGAMLQIVTDQGQPVVLQFNPQAVRFEAAMKLENLKKGMAVRIEEPALNGKFLEPIRLLEVFIPDPSKMNAKSLDERSRYSPGIYPVSQLRKPVPGQQPSPNVRLVGLVVGIEPGKLGLQCGPNSMVIDLAESVSVKFTASSMQFAQPGDSVRGSATRDSSTGQWAAAGSIEVRSSKPFGEASQAMARPEEMKLQVKEKSKAKSKKKEPVPTAPSPELETPTPEAGVPK